MSAYELADWIESSAYGDYTSAKEAANMLRQQADRIAELEKLLEHSVGSDCREMRYIQEIENKDARIAELEKKLQESAMNYISICSQADEHYARVQELEKQGEPVAWIRSGDDQLSLVKEKDDGYMLWKPLYLAPQIKPLSDEEIAEVATINFGHSMGLLNWMGFARAIEERHGIK